MIDFCCRKKRIMFCGISIDWGNQKSYLVADDEVISREKWPNGTAFAVGGRHCHWIFITVQPHLLVIISSFFAKNDNMKRKNLKVLTEAWKIFREPYFFDVQQATYHKRARKDDYDHLAADRCRFLNGKHENFHKNFSTATFKG